MPGPLKGCRYCLYAFHVECLGPGSDSQLAVVYQSEDDEWYCPVCAPGRRVNLARGVPVHVLATMANAGEFRFQSLMAAAGVRRTRDRRQLVKEQWWKRWNLRHRKVLGAGEGRICSLCSKAIHDEYLECDNHKARSATQANTFLRTVGYHGRVGGHLTCFPCLWEEQGIDRRDFACGKQKVSKRTSSETCCSLLFFAAPLPAAYQRYRFALFECFHGVTVDNGSLSTVSH